MNTDSAEIEATNATAVLLSVVAVVGAAVLYFFGAKTSNQLTQSLLYALASAVLPIGIVGFLYEVRLRRSVGREIIRLVGIERSLAKSGIRQASDAAGLGWDGILLGKSQFRMLLVDPVVWVQGNWSKVLAAGQDRAISVTMLLPNPDGHSFSEIARFHAISAPDLRQRIEHAVRMIEQSWSDARQTLMPKSHVRVVYFDGFPSYALVRADRSSTLMLPPCAGQRPADNGYALLFEAGRTDYPTRWFDSELDRLSQGGAVFENRIAAEDK